MELKYLLIFCLILQGDIFFDGYGTDSSDESLMKLSLMKSYNVNSAISDRVLNCLDDEINTETKKLVPFYRTKIQDYLNLD